MDPQPKPVQILVANSKVLSGQVIALALQQDPDLEAAHVSPQSIIEAAQTIQPDVVILSHAADEGFEILKELLALSPKTRVIMLLDDENSDLVVNSLRWGARGVFCRSHPLEMLVDCVKQVHAGQVWITAAQLDFLLAVLAAAPARPIVNASGVQLLSHREQEVIRWIAEGLSNREIARALQISENTAKNYVYRVYNKLGISNRVEAALYAAAHRASPPAKPARSASQSSSPAVKMAVAND